MSSDIPLISFRKRKVALVVSWLRELNYSVHKGDVNDFFYWCGEEGSPEERAMFSKSPHDRDRMSCFFNTLALTPPGPTFSEDDDSFAVNSLPIPKFDWPSAVSVAALRM